MRTRFILNNLVGLDWGDAPVRGCSVDNVREMSVKYRPSCEMLRPTAAAAHCPYQHYPLSSHLYIGSVLFFNRPRSEGCHSTDVLSPFIPVLCHSDRLFHGESCPRLDVVHPGRAWPSSPSCTWHCSLHYLFLQATPLFSGKSGPKDQVALHYYYTSPLHWCTTHEVSKL